MTAVDGWVQPYARLMNPRITPRSHGEAYNHVLSHFRRPGRLMIYFFSYLLVCLSIVLLFCCGFPIYLQATEGPALLT